MTDNVTAFPRPTPPSIVGCVRDGYSVVVDGRSIPRMHCHPGSERTTIVIDDRFIYDVPNDWVYLFASMAAQCLAIGAGYSHSGAESKDHPFAPKVMEIGELIDPKQP